MFTTWMGLKQPMGLISLVLVKVAERILDWLFVGSSCDGSVALDAPSEAVRKNMIRMCFIPFFWYARFPCWNRPMRSHASYWKSRISFGSISGVLILKLDGWDCNIL